MKKLLILIPRMGGGGAERVVSIIANNLCQKYKIQITTLVSDESFYNLDSSIQFTSANYRINRKNNISRLLSLGRNFWNSILFVRRTIEQFEPDIVFSWLEEMDIVTYYATFGLHGFIWISSERNDPMKRNKALQHFLEWIYKKLDMLICQSQTVSDYYKMIPVKKKKVIPNPVDFSNYPNKVAESKEKKIVGVGRLREQKNFKLLIRSFAQIANDYPNVTLTIFGEGPQRTELEKEIQNQGLRKRIFLPGASENVLMDIRDATIYVMSSDYEGFPNALVEAIAMGLPAISTDFDTGIAREIITSDVGIVVPCGDQDALAKAMSTLLEHPDYRRQIRKRGSSAIARFETSRVIEMWDSMFERLV